jgi:hypothetical protein
MRVPKDLARASAGILLAGACGGRPDQGTIDMGRPARNAASVAGGFPPSPPTTALKPIH